MKKKMITGLHLSPILAVTLTLGYDLAAWAATGTVISQSPTLELSAEWIDNGVSQTWSQDISGYLGYDNASGNWWLTSDYHLDSSSLANQLAPDFSIDMKALENRGNFDPFINYSFSVKNNSSKTITFDRVFNAPVSPRIDSANQVRATIAAKLTDATGDGVALTPASDSGVAQDNDGIPEIQILRLHSSATDSWANAGVDVGPSARFNGGAGAYNYGTFSSGPVSGPIGDWNRMQIRDRFSLSGNGDTAAFSGYAEILAVPEPSKGIMFSIGALVVGFMASRRNSMF